MAQPDLNKPDLHLRARRRADMVSSTFVTDTEVDGYIEQAFRELYMRLIAKYEDFFLVSAQITTANSVVNYDLPMDFLKFRGIRHHNDFFLGRIDVKEITLVTPFGQPLQKPRYYWINGQLQGNGNVQLTLAPAPDSAYILDYYYTPFMAMSDIVNGAMRFVTGWDEYCVLTAAIKMKDKEESDCTVLLTERSMLLELMEKSITPLDAAEPFAVVQTAPRFNIYADPFAFEDQYGG